ncbi:MAG TPA: DUF167 domain-containing protein [Acidobacteriaceae bacterium]|nr:DUF167 domain-containing protein [Acidobacteriaceae bacterium]
MTSRVPVRETAQGASFLVRVMPRASRTAIVGVLGDGTDAAVKVALQAPPVEGRANAALIEFLAELLGVARSAIEIAGGETARTKRIVVRGKDAMEVATAIAIALTH